MRYGIVTANLGDYADPRVAVRLARAAEAAGWEAFFVWDNLDFVRGVPSGDPWVILSAVAASTTRPKLGLAVTPLAGRPGATDPLCPPMEDREGSPTSSSTRKSRLRATTPARSTRPARLPRRTPHQPRPIPAACASRRSTPSPPFCVSGKSPS